MSKIRREVMELRDIIVTDDELEFNFDELTDEELDWLVDELYCNWFDIRKTLDEQMLVNTKMYNNHYIYEARESVAKAKFLYAKAEQMMRNNF